ncbi:MAG: hypothetical protein LBU29_03775 [Endomicrobium sp.]|jgi:ESS family glutamate:Na+ symporter|nr:hypothetical protein [Endomicrobium sp.]
MDGLWTLNFNMVQTIALGVVMYYFGIFVRNKIRFLVKLSIPASVIGGFAIVFLTTFLQSQNIAIFHFDMTLQKLLMITFFCTVGMNASYKLLKNDSLLVAAFWGICIVAAIFQNVVGIFFSKLFGINPLMGIICGSVSMMGGLGTATGFGTVFEKTLGVDGAMTMGMACATLGLIIGSALGGPLAEWIIKKRKIATPHSEFLNQFKSNTNDQSSEYEELGALVQKEGKFILSHKETEDFVSGPHLMKSLSLVLVTMGLGMAISYYLDTIGIILPNYLVVLSVAVLFRNISDVSRLFKIDTKAIGMISDISLAIFVTVAISTLNLKQLTYLGMPVLFIVVTQIILTLAMAYSFVFLLFGKNYESAVMAAGFVGFGLGATPNALTNMQTVSAKHGIAVKAFFVVPIVSAFLIDFVNAALIMFFAGIFKNS